MANTNILAPLTATGADQAVVIPSGFELNIYPMAVAELRKTAAGDKFPLPSQTLTTLSRSLGETVYVRAAAGTVIYLSLG